MKAIVLSDTNDFDLIEKPVPVPSDGEILIQVKAISFNPVDGKMRRAGSDRLSTPQLGWDAAGVVVSVGKEVGSLKPGDEVYYSGTVRLEGAYAEYQRMDAALVGRKPTTLNFVEAAVLPLTTLTAYEALIEKMDIQPGKTVLIINGAGGVGSIAIQLAKWRGLRVAVTASPGAPEQWVCRMGADIVVDYHLDLKDQLKKAGVADVDYILNTYDTNLYFQVCCDLLHPGGKMVSIVRPTAPLDLSPMFSKSLGLYFEYMFTKSLFNMPEKASQGEILDLVAGLLDQGILRTTLNHTLAGLTLENVLTAHQMLLSGKTIGKIGLEM